MGPIRVNMPLKFDESSNLGNLILSFSSPLDNPDTKPLETIYKGPYRGYITKNNKKHNSNNKYPRPDHFWCILHYQWCIKKQRHLDKINGKIIFTYHYLAYQKVYGSSIGTQISFFSPKINNLWKLNYLNYKNRINKYGKYKPKVIPTVLTNSVLFNTSDRIDRNYITIHRVDYEAYGETLRLCG